jgi:hypothetical protein
MLRVQIANIRADVAKVCVGPACDIFSK